MTQTELSAHTKDFTLPEGCLLCGADLPIRVTPTGACGVCVRCGWITRPTVNFTHQGLQVTLETVAEA